MFANAGMWVIALSAARERPAVPPKVRGLAPRVFSLAVTAAVSTPPLMRIAVLGGVPIAIVVSAASTSSAMTFVSPTANVPNCPDP